MWRVELPKLLKKKKNLKLEIIYSGAVMNAMRQPQTLLCGGSASSPTETIGSCLLPQNRKNGKPKLNLNSWRLITVLRDPVCVQAGGQRGDHQRH